MDTNAAMRDALKRPSIRKKINANTLRSIKKRFNDGIMRLDKKVEFLIEHGYFVRAEINWGKPKRNKKVAAVVEKETEYPRVSRGGITDMCWVEQPSVLHVPTCSICRIPFPCNCAQEEQLL